jgi:hypothetical protein
VSLWSRIRAALAPKRMAPEVARRQMHWSPGPEGLPLCGASKRERWTLELAAATCSACRAKGLPMAIQYDWNTR